VKTEQTFEQIVLEHAAMLRRIVCSHEADEALAEELLQEIHFAIWRALPSFRGASSIRTFVARVAINRALTHVGRAVRSPPTTELDTQLSSGEGSPEFQAIAVDRRSRLVAAVRDLPLAYRDVATLTLEGLTPKEISQTLGVSVNAVAIRLSRAKQLLRQSVGEHT